MRTNIFRDYKKGTTFKGGLIDISKNGIAIDLVGTKVSLQLKENGKDDIVFEFSTENDRLSISNDPPGRIIVLPFLIKLPVAEYNTSLILTYSNETVKELFNRKWKITQ